MLYRTWEIAQGCLSAQSIRACLENSQVTRDQQRQVAFSILNAVPHSTSPNGALLLTWLLDTSNVQLSAWTFGGPRQQKQAERCTWQGAKEKVLQVRRGCHVDNDTSSVQVKGVDLTTETVKSASLSLEGVDDVKRSDCASLSVLRVGDRVADDGFEEELEDTARLVVDEARDTLDTATSRQTTDSGLGDTLDVVSEDLAVSFGAALAETLATFSSSRH